MGRYARTVPTAENVANAIARLKPAKREEWCSLAEEQGWEFEEYVTARIERNIKHRRRLEQNGVRRLEQNEVRFKEGSPVRRRSTAELGDFGASFVQQSEDERRQTQPEQDSQALGDGSPVQTREVSATDDGFEAFSTQQIQSALSRRKRRHRDSWPELPSKRFSAAQGSHDLPQAPPVQSTFQDIIPTAPPPRNPSRLQRSDSYLRLAQQDEEAPPSGGAASRADTSFARTTSFVTATEGDEESHSISSSNLPSPISPSESQEDFLKLGPDTQMCQKFLDSTQGRALDGLEHFTTPRTHRETSPLAPSPNHSTRDPTQSPEVPPLDLPRWVLKLKNVPHGAAGLWCVRKGLVPGFHFQEPWLPPLSQSRAFHEMRFEYFSITDNNIEDIMEQANRYMNHRPQDCVPDYAMCHLDCARLLNVKTEPAMRFKTPQVQLPSRKHHLTEEGNRCRLCDRLLEAKRALLCESCITGPFPDPDIAFCVKMFNLAEEQTEVLREAARGRNVFYTGAAGTGKSTTLRAVVRYFHRKRVCVEVVSPTGIAALNVGGKTTHSFAGWTTKAERLPLDRLGRIACGDKNWKRLNEPDVLIIDEISMVSSHTLSRPDYIMQSARKVAKPFGGVQVVVTGDLHQLPPVKAFKTCLTCGRETENPGKGPWFHCPCAEHGSFHKSQQWTFASPTWDECRFHYIELQQIHRQRDPEFSSLLNKIRIGTQLTSDEEDLLLQQRPGFESKDILEIHPRRRDVARINTNRLHAIEQEKFGFQCVDGFWWNKQLHPELEGRFDRVDPDNDTSCLRAYSSSSERSDERHRFDEEFNMKVGMPALLLINLSLQDGLVNGSRGVVVGFEQYAFASKTPRIGVRGKKTNRLEDWLLFGDHAHYQLGQIDNFIERQSDRRWPIVKFDNGITCAIRPHCEVEELGHVPEEASQERFSLMSRTQIPLVAGWAITTHKSQGMTLDKAIVDLDGSWEPGQVYTALSRVRSLAGLRVLSTARGKANRADQTVVEFMRKHFGDGRKT